MFPCFQDDFADDMKTLMDQAPHNKKFKIIKPVPGKNILWTMEFPEQFLELSVVELIAMMMRSNGRGVIQMATLAER